MIADLKPYPTYKDSGVPWLGEVPEHWEVRKLRHVLERLTERNRPYLPLLSVVR
jgi:type I restriction enzyme S subunit